MSEELDLSQFFDMDKLNKQVAHGVCHYVDDDPSIGMCGGYAEYKLPMPDPIPDMPLCKRHNDEVLGSGWTDEDSEMIVMGYLFDALGDEDDDDFSE